jgi:hypothetical protein
MKSVHQGSVLKLTSADDSSMLISCYANCQHSTTVVYIGPPEQASYGRACTAQQGSPGNLPSTDAACWWPRTPACPMRHPLVSPGRQGNAQRRHGAGATGRANAWCRLGSPRSRVPTPRPPRTTGVRTPVGMAASPVTSIAEYRRMYVSILSPPSSFLVHANHALRFVRWLSDDASISLFPFRLSNSPARPLRHAHSKHTHACAERHI